MRVSGNKAAFSEFVALVLDLVSESEKQLMQSLVDQLDGVVVEPVHFTHARPSGRMFSFNAAARECVSNTILAETSVGGTGFDCALVHHRLACSLARPLRLVV
jgi:hypothetical protein